MITQDIIIMGLESIKKNSTNKVDIAIINDAIKEIEKYEELINKTSKENIGNFSDGYHTFNELYYHRAILFSVICNNNKTIAWKSKQHHDGTMFNNMFIVGMDTPKGQATYHYDITPYWNLFEVKELERAPLWDGHTSDQALERISSIRTNDELVRDVKRFMELIPKVKFRPLQDEVYSLQQKLSKVGKEE